MDTWTALEADRKAFADYLATLSPQDWDTKSWCEAWTVKDVVAHTLVIPTMSKGTVFGAFVKSGFNLDKMSDKFVKQITASTSTSEMVAKTRATAGVRSAPPGLKPVGVLSEVLIHASDISMAVGKPFTLPVDHYVASLDHMKNVQPTFGCKKRIAGLKLQATDTTWSTGSGPVVEGRAQDLLQAMTGRRKAIDNLTGDGIATLRQR